jgi:hypothetical protein
MTLVSRFNWLVFDDKVADKSFSIGHVTTKDGHLVITMEKKTKNGYEYTSGMLQSWNKFCFTGGYIEVSVSLPGTAQNVGFVSFISYNVILTLSHDFLTVAVLDPSSVHDG